VPAESHAYLGLRSGFSIVAVDGEGNLQELSRTDLGDVRQASHGSFRTIVARGDRVFVRRLWPNEFVEFDVKDPEEPRYTRSHYRHAMEAWERQDGYIYRTRGAKVRLYDPKDPYHRPVPSLELAIENPRRGIRAEPILRDGFGYAVMDDELAIFELPPLK
jgi:hypothetical protein